MEGDLGYTGLPGKVYVPADGYGQIDLTAKVKSLDPETRRGQIAMIAKSNGKKIFGRAFANVQFG